MKIYTITIIVGEERLKLSFKSFVVAKDMLSDLIETAYDSDNGRIKFQFEEEIDE